MLPLYRGRVICCAVAWSLECGTFPVLVIRQDSASAASTIAAAVLHAQPRLSRVVLLVSH